MIGMPGDDVANRLLMLAADFVAVLRDPTSRLDDLAAATKAAQAAIKEAKAERKAADERTALFKVESDRHNDTLLRGRQAFEHERNEFERLRGALIDEQKKLRDQAKADAEQASEKLKLLNEKLAAINAAAAA